MQYRYDCKYLKKKKKRMNVRYYRCLYYFLFLYHPPPLPFSIDQVRRPNMKYLPRPECLFFFLFFTNDVLLWLMWCFVIVLWKISYNNLFREFYFLYHTISYLRVFRSCAEVYPDFSIVAWHGDNRICVWTSSSTADYFVNNWCEDPGFCLLSVCNFHNDVILIAE